MPSGASSGDGAPVGGSLVHVAGASVGACVFILDDNQISWHLFELVNQPLALHFSQDASLIVVSEGKRRQGLILDSDWSKP